jgi:3-oxoacyl-[acyl-carrier-protein] synthase-3
MNLVFVSYLLGIERIFANGEDMMKNQYVQNVGILSTGKYLPEKVVTNFDLEKIVDTSDEWITEKTGIKERRVASESEHTSDMGVKALLDAVKRAGISLDEIDLVISGSNTPDHKSPQMACLMMNKLGMTGTPGFDVRSGGCPGGVFSLSVGARFIADGTYKTVAVVIPELNSRVVNWKDRTTCVILGDGAGCYILRATKNDTGIIHTKLGSEPSGYYAAYVPGGGDALRLTKENIDDGLQYFHMDGKSVFEFGTSIIPKMAEEMSEATNIPINEVDFFLTHQANANIIKQGLEKVGVPYEKALVNVTKYGNMSGASMPVALTEAVDDGLLTPGKVIFLLAFGAGLSYGSIALRWSDRSDFICEEKD